MFKTENLSYFQNTFRIKFVAYDIIIQKKRQIAMIRKS